MKDLVLKWTAVEDLTGDQKKKCCTHDHLGIVNIKYPNSGIVDKKVASVILVGSILTPKDNQWIGYVDHDLICAEGELDRSGFPADAEVLGLPVEVAYVNIDSWEIEGLED